MALLFHGDCLEEMKQLDDNSVDFIFCDLPYGQTSCKWDIKIDMVKFWNEIMRIKKVHTPIFMTTTTKYGVELITSAPKKCPFRYDLVWVKSAPAGFLSAKKMPMRKHEMVYVFYEKLPLYDLSSHKHKFIKSGDKGVIDNIYGNVTRVDGKKGQYNPPLPVSVVKEPENNNKEEKYIKDTDKKYKTCYGEVNIPKHPDSGARYEPALPNSMLEIKSTRGKHSTEKPVALIEWLLKYYSKEGDVVLDPTMGSGSTGIACKNMNRNFIGIEMNDEYYELCCNRLYE